MNEELIDKLHKEILSHCFDDISEENLTFRKLKYDYKTKDFSYILDWYPSEEEFYQDISILLSIMTENLEVYYDAYINILFDISLTCNIPININIVKEFVEIILEKERLCPIDMVSLSLIRSLLFLIDNGKFDYVYWKHKYNTYPILAHIFACAIFKIYGFDEKLYEEVCLKTNYKYLLITLEESGVLVPENPDEGQISLDDLKYINAKLSKQVQSKILSDASNQTIKNIVYN